MYELFVIWQFFPTTKPKVINNKMPDE